jgi:hypothetical protein
MSAAAAAAGGSSANQASASLPVTLVDVASLPADVQRLVQAAGLVRGVPLAATSTNVLWMLNTEFARIHLPRGTASVTGQSAVDSLALLLVAVRSMRISEATNLATRYLTACFGDNAARKHREWVVDVVIAVHTKQLVGSTTVIQWTEEMLYDLLHASLSWTSYFDAAPVARRLAIVLTPLQLREFHAFVRLTAEKLMTKQTKNTDMDASASAASSAASSAAPMAVLLGQDTVAALQAESQRKREPWELPDDTPPFWTPGAVTRLKSLLQHSRDAQRQSYDAFMASLRDQGGAGGRLTSLANDGAFKISEFLDPLKATLAAVRQARRVDVTNVTDVIDLVNEGSSSSWSAAAAQIAAVQRQTSSPPALSPNEWNDHLESQILQLGRIVRVLPPNAVIKKLRELQDAIKARQAAGGYWPAAAIAASSAAAAAACSSAASSSSSSAAAASSVSSAVQSDSDEPGSKRARHHK